MMLLFIAKIFEEITMSKPRQVKRRKRKNPYQNLPKGSGFKHTFSSFAALAAHLKETAK